MRLTAQQLYPLLALLALAGGTVWLERTTRIEEPRTAGTQRSAPDFTAEQTRMTGFDKHGRRHFELVADRVIHYPSSDVTRLEQPRLRYDTAEGELSVEAHQGEIAGDGKLLRLDGNVRAVRPASASKPALSFASASLTVWPEDERAETTDPVTLTQGENTAQADGMKTDNLFGTLELLGNARVHIPRPSRTTP